jgi:hypothetical protein
MNKLSHSDQKGIRPLLMVVKSFGEPEASLTNVRVYYS